MSKERHLIRQGSQYLGEGFSLGFGGAFFRATDQGGGLYISLGVADSDGRRIHQLEVGDVVRIHGGVDVMVVDIFVSPDGFDSAAVFDIESGAALHE